MRRFRNSLLVLLVCGLCAAQNASIMRDMSVRRVGERLACLCKSCKNSVGTCQMIGCHYAAPAREKIAQMLTVGAGDDQIVAKFVEQGGIQALVVPPASGFSLLSWIMPGVAILIGLGGIGAYIRRFRKPAVTAEGVEIDPAVLERYRERIDKDIEKLD